MLGMFYVLYDSSLSLNSEQQGEMDEEPENPYQWVVKYATPTDPLVVQKTEEILTYTGYDGEISINDIYELQDWVAGNIRYKKGDPQYPSDTLKSFEGNCYNKAILLYSMILHEARDDTDFCGCYILLIDALEEESVDVVKHTAVMTVFNSGIIISDTTIDEWAVPDLCVLDTPRDAVYNIIDGTTLQWYTVTTAVSQTKHYEFNSNEGFYDIADKLITDCLGGAN
jgi:hypothetical protein